MLCPRPFRLVSPFTSPPLCSNSKVLLLSHLLFTAFSPVPPGTFISQSYPLYGLALPTLALFPPILDKRHIIKTSDMTRRLVPLARTLGSPHALVAQYANFPAAGAPMRLFDDLAILLRRLITLPPRRLALSTRISTIRTWLISSHCVCWLSMNGAVEMPFAPTSSSVKLRECCRCTAF